MTIERSLTHTTSSGDASRFQPTRESKSISRTRTITIVRKRWRARHTKERQAFVPRTHGGFDRTSDRSHRKRKRMEHSLTNGERNDVDANAGRRSRTCFFLWCSRGFSFPMAFGMRDASQSQHGNKSTSDGTASGDAGEFLRIRFLRDRDTRTRRADARTHVVPFFFSPSCGSLLFLHRIRPSQERKGIGFVPEPSLYER